MPPKRRRRFQGLYYHSSPPKVMPMNGQAGGQNIRKRRDNEDFSVKLSTIRIWIHEKDIGKLTRILWGGQGNRLCQQASNNGRVKRFLAAVPHVMNAIKDLHQAVIDNNLETVQAQLEPPVPSALVTCKDGNGLNIIHKAAGLGHTKLLEYLVGIWPEGAHETDITGKTPLHWAASAKNNMRCYTLLTQAGCDEEAVDYKMKTPSYYRHKPHEIERAFLVYVPDAPRVSPDSATDWEALCDEGGVDNGAGGDASSKKLDIKVPPSVNGRKSLDDSLENTSELDTNDGTSANEDDDLSKADAEPEAEVASPLQRRPETPATFNTINGEGDGEDSEVENIRRAVSADGGGEAEENGVGQDEGGGGDAVIVENGGVHEEAPEEDQPTEPEDVGQPEEPATESELDGNKKTEVEPEEPVEQVEQVVQAEQVEHEAHEEQETVDEPESNAEDEADPEVATMSVEEREPESENDNDDDDEDVIASDSKGSNPQEGQQPGGGAQPPEDDGNESLTSAMAIEGFVHGAPEDYTVQSQTAVDEDERIKRIVESGDLEQLAEIVLNGEGGSLVGLKSPEPEIQAFLNNVPSYMEKIHRVHDAARDGGLLALQQALDRRKFAIAKNDISPNGSTPLHVAVLFGHTDIVRYLASRFPETMTITDNDGRTPLHYAATIKDNGHFYNMLLQLGANPKSLDKLGHSAEFYLDKDKAKNILNYTELLNIFGAEELENQLLNDQGQAQPVSFQANPIFKTEQGKYLADSLADPLIKALTEIANKRPRDPVAYLTNYLQHFMGDRKPMTEVQVHSGSSKASTSSTSTLALAKSNASSNQRLGNTRNGPGPTNADLIELDARSVAEEEDAEGALAVQHMEERDEHGQSMLHFACARSHRRGALYTLIEESGIDITYRDELYRTARDVSLQANQPNNAAEIDRYVMAQAVIGDVEPFEQLALQGYDHILDIEDENGQSIIDVVQSRQNAALGEFLANLRGLEETREELHQMIRENNMERVVELTNVANAKWLIRTKNYYGRTALHIAVLKESEEMVQHMVKICPEALKIPDNLERTVLHYAMGTNALESVSRILIQNGAKRTAKDLKGRQPSYYFINKADILRLQEEEEESR
ncbi:uncharacterized protein LOC6735763 isoform X1 [Drosophila simulans]|uniref:Uncharacterized protein, isoform I n=1 Tax=Drosophila simulans TaxID=7240 RepID=A0A0J9RIN9_DROSI|nr:uncharacterized protein LOC6735763 isoform X1 [Drosophila simulans]KMY95883.1 uncharacterized protein Dsimw501_GD11706, isoform I [Drosophila simulans]